MMHFVTRGDPSKDFDRVLRRRLGNVDGREAARQRRVAFHVLAVLDVGRRSDARQLTACERRLELVREVVGRIAPREQRVHLVDEEHDLAIGALDLELKTPHPLGERAPDTRARHQPSSGELDHDGAFEAADPLATVR